MNNNFNEGRLADRGTKLAEYERKRKEDIAALVTSGILVVGSIVVNNTPAITNESIQFMAGTVQSILPIIVGINGLSAYNLIKDSRVVNDLSNKQKSQNNNNSEQLENNDDMEMKR